MLLLTFDFSSSSKIEFLEGGGGNGSNVYKSTHRIVTFHISPRKTTISINSNPYRQSHTITHYTVLLYLKEGEDKVKEVELDQPCLYVLDHI